MSEKEGRRGEWRHSHWILTKSSADLLLLTPTCGPCMLVVMTCALWGRLMQSPWAVKPQKTKGQCQCHLPCCMHELVRLGEEVTAMDRQGRSSAPTLTLGFSLSSWAQFLKEATDGRTPPQTLCCLQSRRGRLCAEELRNLFLGCEVTANPCHLSPSDPHLLPPAQPQGSGLPAEQPGI